MRRVARALLIAVGALLGLVVAAVLGLLIYLHTDWGRETVRRITEEQLSKLITGRVEMGPITGSVVTRFTVHGFVVRDQYGAEVLRVKEVHADWSPLALLRKRVRVHSGVVIGAVVTGRRDAAGRLTFA